MITILLLYSRYPVFFVFLKPYHAVHHEFEIDCGLVEPVEAFQDFDVTIEFVNLLFEVETLLAERILKGLL